jgi:hypothetical protein
MESAHILRSSRVCLPLRFSHYEAVNTKLIAARYIAAHVKLIFAQTNSLSRAERIIRFEINENASALRQSKTSTKASEGFPFGQASSGLERKTLLPSAKAANFPLRPTSVTELQSQHKRSARCKINVDDLISLE